MSGCSLGSHALPSQMWVFMQASKSGCLKASVDLCGKRGRIVPGLISMSIAEMSSTSRVHLKRPFQVERRSFQVVLWTTLPYLRRINGYTWGLLALTVSEDLASTATSAIRWLALAHTPEKLPDENISLSGYTVPRWDLVLYRAVK